MTELDYRSS